MKKTILCCALGLISTGIFAQQRAVTTNNDDVSRWSLGVKGGVDFYRVKPDGNHAGWDVALMLEYGITPIFGMGLEAGYFNYDRSRNWGDFNGNTIDAIIYGSTNISNLVAPVRTGFWSNVNLYSTTGFGVGFYNYDIDFNNPLNRNKDDNGVSGVAVFGMDLAFNLGNAWELAVGGQYRYYIKNDLGGHNTATFGNDALTINLGFRYKFGAGSGRHVRNMTTAEYYPMANISLSNTNINVDAETLRRIKELENANLASQVKQLEKELQGLKSCDQGTIARTLHNVEFAFNSAELTAEGKQTLNEIAKVLKNNSDCWSSLVIEGYTDNIGTDQVNQRISQNRANTVKNYLVSNGISAGKLTSEGHGENDPIATNQTREGRQMNRRVEFEITR